MEQGEITYNPFEKTYSVKYENRPEQKCSTVEELVNLLGDFEIVEEGRVIKSNGVEFRLNNPSTILENIMNRKR